ncbi:CBS domain-containing protein [Desulfurivibrio alkaliphilus]|uniref:CBS domain containing membrane protein n=1 Tax=Desulfurivibrio alkaliphilus (strain DSM 19089 / UNIQEM U267 / AHT2) TaxID=589865 RepID=D6Z6J5_DESAT|nr:CBS domain-containing protein [Desulfurivibrio alkaliphilus]ADH84954.1 CBS domain containing membrane protein [Desulfurivibrio alkaliphilus AHT 2]
MQLAKDIMTAEVITVSPDLPVEKLASLLWERRISGAPVVDEQGELVGVVTESDLIDQAKKLHIPTAIAVLEAVIYLERGRKVEEELNKMAGSTVKDICTTKPATVAPDTPLDEIATVMAEKHLHTLPVMDRGKLVGVVGKADVIRALINK